MKKRFFAFCPRDIFFILSALALLTFWSTASARAATNVYYSVGQSTSTNLEAGSSTITIAAGTGAFSIAQTGNIGVGDQINYGTSSVAYISGKVNANDLDWSLVTATGGVPADITNATVTSINRAFSSLYGALVGFSSANHLATTSLVGANVILNIPCYYDSGPDTTTNSNRGVDGGSIGIVTGPNNYLNVYTPNNTSTQANFSQRHGGAWTSNAYQLVFTGGYGLINLVAGGGSSENYARFTGLQMELITTSTTQIAGLRLFYADSAVSGGYVDFDSNIIQIDAQSSGGNGAFVSTYQPPPGLVIVMANNILYNTGYSSAMYGIESGASSTYLYSNTVYNTYEAYYANSSGVTISFKNNIAQNDSIGYGFHPGATFDASSTNNLSDHNDAPGLNPQSSANVDFVSTSTNDFDLSPFDTAARGHGANLTADQNYPFSTDIAGRPRPATGAWDIGAAEYVSSDTTPPAVTWVSTADNAAVSSTIPLTASSTDNVAVEKVVFYAGTYGSSLSSSTLISSTTSANGDLYSVSWNTADMTNGLATLWVQSIDNSDNISSASTTVRLENPPSISSVFATPGATSTAVIAWDTNEPATAQVNYGTTSAYGASTTTSAFATSTSITLTGLDPSTTYHFQVAATDADGYTALGGDETFTTGALVVNIPVGGNIQAAVDANPAGTTFNLAAGTYYNQSIQPQSGDTFVGAIGGDGSRLTVFTGAQTLGQFALYSGNIWSATTTQTSPGYRAGTLTSACNSGYPRCDYPEDLFYDGQPYHNTNSTSSLAAGYFYFNYPSGTIYLDPANSGDNPNSHQVLYSRTPSVFSGSANNVTIKNVIVEYYASPIQFGAIGAQTPGSGWTIDNVEAFSNNGAGIRMASSSVLENSYIHDNGQDGSDGGGSNLLVKNNDFYHNVDYTGFGCSAECGPLKLVASSSVVEGNYIHDNTNDGVWFDVYSGGNTIQDNIIKGNTGSGISYEISSNGIIRNNVIVGGTEAIGLHNSSNNEVYGNVGVMTSQGSAGVMVYDEYRTDMLDSNGTFIPTQNDIIHDNTINYYSGFAGQSGVSSNYDMQNFATTIQPTNKFSTDHYHVSTGTVEGSGLWTLVSATGTSQNLDFSAFQAAGYDASGTLDAVLPSSANTTPPTVAVTAPGAGATIDGSYVFSVLASGSPGIAQVQFQIDGQDEGRDVYGAPYQTTVDTTALSNGSHTMTAIAYDTAGNLSSSTVTFSVDNIVSPSPVVMVAGGGELAPLSPVTNNTSPTSSISTFPSSVTQASSLELLQSLRAEVAALEAQLVARMGNQSSSFIFTHDLSLWKTGSDVKQLQLFLISQNSGPAAQKLSRHGTTDVFGMLTYGALVEFQKKVGIRPASGYFGPITRMYVNGR